MVKPGCCGDDCNYCPRYLATVSGNEKRLEEIAGLWQMIGWRNGPTLTEEMVCHGCETVHHCGLGIRECAVEKGIDCCGKCRDYPCEKLLNIFENNEKESRFCRENFPEKDFELFQKAFFSKKERLDKISLDYDNLT